jgi:AAA family ATP:ADP antiporter
VIADPPHAKGTIERLLAPIADVRAGEARGALLLAALMFLLLTGYYLLKTAREVFILSEGGAEVKSYAAAGQAVVLLVLVPTYGAFASHVNRRQLVTWVTLFFASNVVMFAAAAHLGFRIGIVYFLWFGIFNVMVIAQFWAFAADLYTQEQGKRLFPLIGVGSSLGAWMGSVRAGTVVDAIGPLRLLLGGAAILAVCVLLARLADPGARERTPSAEPRDRERESVVGGGQTGFGMLRSDRYLGLIAVLAVLLNVVNTSGEYLFGRYVVESAQEAFGSGPETAEARARFIGDAYSRLYSQVNLIGFLLQMFVVSRLFAFLGVGRALFIQPIVAGLGYLMMLRAPSFEAMRLLKTADNALDYSLGNTSRQALWLPTSRQAKYKAKQAVDSFFVRMGDVLQAGVVFAGELAAFAVPAFAAVNLALTGGWFVVVAALNGQLRARARAGDSAL